MIEKIKIKTINKMGRKRVNPTDTYIISIGIGDDINCFLSSVNNRSLYIKNLIYESDSYMRWNNAIDNQIDLINII
jgi:hypothetical protein